MQPLDSKFHASWVIYSRSLWCFGNMNHICICRTTWARPHIPYYVGEVLRGICVFSRPDLECFLLLIVLLENWM